MVIVVLFVLVLMFFGLVFWVCLAFLGNVERDQTKAEQNARQILDYTFDGRPDVTFRLNMRTLKYETVIIGAKERGYDLAHQAGDPNGAMTLIFKKVSADVPPAAP